MFSQWRHAVESLAQVPKPSGSPDGAPGEEAPARSSLDSLGIRTSISSSSQLAETALSSLRKTLVVQRPASPANAQRPASPANSQTSTSAAEPATTPAPKPRSGRTTLEDRLRAKFAVGDVSNSSTPVTSARATPSPVPVADHPFAGSSSRSSTPDIPVVKGPPNPLSPTSAPLPDSPLTSPSLDPPLSLSASAASISSASLPEPVETPPEPASQSRASVLPTAGEETDTLKSFEPEASYPPSQPIPVDVAPGDANEPSLPEEPSDTPTPSVETESPEPIPTTYANCAPVPAEPSATTDEGSASDTPSIQTEETVQHTPSPRSASQEPESEVVTDINPNPEPLPQSEMSQAEPVAQTEGSSVTPAQAEASPAEPPTDVQVPTARSDAPTADPLTATTPLAADVAVQRASLEAPSRTATPDGRASDKADVEALQKRLKLVEQRFADVSTSFKRLQAEKLAADRVLRELTSVESVTEVDALRDFLQNMSLKNEMAHDEIRRLNGKLTRQDERIEELRDIHRLESKSQSDQIDRLKTQIEEAEKLLKAAQSATSQAELESATRQAEIVRLKSELDKATNTAKDEEEKRTKAIALLKTVRQKLVKAEKERDDAEKEVSAIKEAEKAERERERAERARLQSEIDKAHAEKETAVHGLRAQFDKEVAALKEKHEKELAALRGQFELEAITTKTTHVRELEGKKSRIADLENTVKTLSREKDELFDQLQLRQAELESSQSALESLQGQNTELQYQLREANDRVALLQEEFSDVQREQEVKVSSASPSAEEITRLLAAAESKYEAKLSDLRRRLIEAERERDEGEAHWSKKFAERAQEVEELKAAIESSQKSKAEELAGVEALKGEIQALRAEIRSYQKQVADLHAQLERAAEVEMAAKAQLGELSSKAADLQQYVDESKNREAQLRTQNKTLREELRKVQSSVALLEKQRNPGVGYWASRNESTSEIRSPRSSVSDLARETPSRPSTPSTIKSDEEVNFEYLRNVILQFLEHKEMRPHLVRILSTILHFTPQETRRLVAKV